MKRQKNKNHILPSNNTSLIKIINSKKFNPKKQDDNERTILHIAAINSDEEAITLLKDKGADPNIKDAHDSTALHLAAKENNPTIVKLLIEMGSEINAQDRYGNTPLHLATQQNNQEIIEELLANKANMNVVNLSSMTPLSIALKNKNITIATLIREAGGKTQKSIIETLKLAYLNSSIIRKIALPLFIILTLGFALVATIETRGELSLLLIASIFSSIGFAIICLGRPYKMIRNLEAKALSNRSHNIEIEDLLTNK